LPRPIKLLIRNKITSGTQASQKKSNRLDFTDYRKLFGPKGFFVLPPFDNCLKEIVFILFNSWYFSFKDKLMAKETQTGALFLKPIEYNDSVTRLL